MAAPTVAAQAPLLQGQYVVEDRGGGDPGAGTGALDHQWLGSVAVRPEGDAGVGAAACGEGIARRTHYEAPVGDAGLAPRHEREAASGGARRCEADAQRVVGRVPQRLDPDRVRLELETGRPRNDQQLAAHVLAGEIVARSRFGVA